MNERNLFNGYFLKYLLTEDLISQINKYFSFKETISLIPYNSIPMHSNDFKNVISVLGPTPRIKEILADNDFVLPIGLFSNDNFKLECKFAKTDREFNIPLSEAENVKLNLELTDHQIEIVNLLNEEVKRIAKNKSPVYLTLSSPCGAGKTVLATYIISVFKLKTFIIVNTLELGKQWHQRITETMTNVKCLCSTNGATALLKNPELTKADIIIFPDKHLSNNDFVFYLVKHFSMGIIDEQHVYNIEMNINMKRFLTLTSFNYMFSLSATPRENNSFFLGKIIKTKEIVREIAPLTFTQNAHEISSKSGKDYKIKIPNASYYDEYISISEAKSFPNKINLLSIKKKQVLAFDVERIKTIVHTIISKIEVEKDPKILILTRFVDEIEIYYNQLLPLVAQGINLYAVYTSTSKSKYKNGVSLNEIKESLAAQEKFIIIATQDNVGTGIDIPSLNIMHLTSLDSNPSKVEQYIGRISRNNNSKNHHLFYYTFCSYARLKFSNEIKNIRSVLEKDGWTIFVPRI